jgi:hypothetical protein
LTQLLNFTFTTLTILTALTACNNSDSLKNKDDGTDTAKMNNKPTTLNTTAKKDSISIWVYDYVTEMPIKNREITQQMGTSGADDYMTTTTFTLTELKGIKYVNFDFEEGDHAVPGTYSRQYYIDRNKNSTHKTK